MADCTAMLARKSLFAILAFAAGCNTFAGGEESAPAPSTGDEGPPPAPPVSGTPSQDEITEAFGVFVAQPGASDADGSRAKPFGSIATATERARATSKRVYVCSGTFKEAVVLARGISVIGGFDCSAAMWKVGSTKTKVESPTSPALRAEGIDYPTRVEGFDFVAPDGTAASPSSMGLLAKSAGAVTLARSTISAGKGLDGAAGVEGVQLTLTVTTPPGPGSVSYTEGDTRVTGAGGTGGAGSCSGPGVASIPAGAGGVGGLPGMYQAYFYPCPEPLEQGQCPVQGGDSWYWKVMRLCFPDPEVCTDSNPGAGNPGQGSPAQAGRDGVSASRAGIFTVDGFVTSAGTRGTNGTAGRGGKGGVGGEPFSPWRTSQGGQGSGGAGGGVGGCPGLAGTEGAGGGASVGALISNSAGFTFEDVELVARDGGAGGPGTVGSKASVGGEPAASQYSALAAGQAGEAGGRSGVSGSGAGGSSVGIAYRAGEPNRVRTTIRIGVAGRGVPELKKTDVGNVRTLPASVPGEAKELLEF